MLVFDGCVARLSLTEPAQLISRQFAESVTASMLWLAGPVGPRNVLARRVFRRLGRPERLRPNCQEGEKPSRNDETRTIGSVVDCHGQFFAGVWHSLVAHFKRCGKPLVPK